MKDRGSDSGLTVTGLLKRGRAGIYSHERKVGREEAEAQNRSVESLKEMRMGRDLWEPRIMTQPQDNTNVRWGEV